VHFLVLGRRDNACCGFRLIDRAVAVDFGAARLRFRSGAQWLRSGLGMVEPLAVAIDRIAVLAGQQLGMQHRVRLAHASAPCRKSEVGVAGCGSRGI
jgi:hypothetical protein